MLACTPGSGRAADRPPAVADDSQIVDVGDIWRWVRHKDPSVDPAASAQSSERPPYVLAPSIGSKPSTGLNGGVSGNVAFFRGDPSTTRISSLSGGLKVSAKGQTLTGLKFAMFSKDDRWFVQGDNRFWWTSQNIYGPGITSAGSPADVRYDFFRVQETAYRRLAAGWFVGVGMAFNSHSHVEPVAGADSIFERSSYVSYSGEHGLPKSAQRSAGTTFGLLYDTRDNGINPQRGSLASAAYRTFFDGFLGGNSTWQELYVDVRTYRRLSADAHRKLAFWFLGDIVTGGVAPFFDLPSIASDGRSARGYSEGRYRGERLLYGELEYRETLTRNGFLGYVAFLNATTVGSNETGEHLFDAVAPAAGFGFRFLLSKRSKTNLCTDYGWGRAGSRGFYLAVQEAF
jgi:hypothetical protein